MAKVNNLDIILNYFILHFIVTYMGNLKCELMGFTLSFIIAEVDNLYGGVF
jgi:hypothetical protein